MRESWTISKKNVFVLDEARPWRYFNISLSSTVKFMQSLGKVVLFDVRLHVKACFCPCTLSLMMYDWQYMKIGLPSTMNLCEKIGQYQFVTYVISNKNVKESFWHQILLLIVYGPGNTWNLHCHWRWTCVTLEECRFGETGSKFYRNIWPRHSNRQKTKLNKSVWKLRLSSSTIHVRTRSNTHNFRLNERTNIEIYLLTTI